MKLQPTLAVESESTKITRADAAFLVRKWRLLGAEIKRYDRKNGKAYLAYNSNFSSTLILTK